MATKRTKYRLFKKTLGHQINLNRMFNIINCYTKLQNNTFLDKKDCDSLLVDTVSSFQYASLIVLLLNRTPNTHECNLIHSIFNIYPKLHYYISCCFQIELINFKLDRQHPNPDDNQHYKKLLHAAKNKESFGYLFLENIITQFTMGIICLDFMSIWLMLIYCYGMKDEDLYDLTQIMYQSGKVYDYRNLPELNYAKIARRYPTGALSEKTALILPSLIASISDKYNIKTPFLVAKSLSFTGGTWDKLLSIPFFTFPSPGTETINTMSECSAAMSVTKDDANPADRLLYQFRSITGTVDCLPLLASSIASKQLSFPADFLLLDVRYGIGSFCKDFTTAKKLAEIVCRILNKAGIQTEATFQDTVYPNGICIGNAAEVAEGIVVMNSNTESLLHSPLIDEQKNLVIKFFSQIMATLFPHEKKSFFESLAHKKFKNGDVLFNFKKLLTTHKVPNHIAENICSDPETFLHNSASISFPVYLHKKGILIGLDQKKLGNCINFHINSEITEGNNISKKYNGIILYKMLNEHINYGDKICEVFLSKNHSIVQDEINEIIKSCFIIQ